MRKTLCAGLRRRRDVDDVARMERASRSDDERPERTRALNRAGRDQ